MLVYMEEVEVGCYTITAISETREKCIAALVNEYKRQFGSFTENGFRNKADWLECHGISEESCWGVELGRAFTR